MRGFLLSSLGMGQDFEGVIRKKAAGTDWLVIVVFATEYASDDEQKY
jgi:hypothetical protein